jgi:hypothetical protein
MINFSHLIILKVSPYYIQSISGEDAIKTCAHYRNDDIVGIAVAKDSGFEVVRPTMIVALKPVEQKFISHQLIEEEEEALKEVMDEKKDQPKGT